MKLQIENLSVTLDKTPILRDLSLTVEEGSFFSLLGPSGCGKSTLLKTVAGIYTPTAGCILLGGREITSLPPHKRGTVILFQDIRLFPHMTVLENVAYPLKMQGVPRTERQKAALALLEKVQLSGYGTRRPSSLSGGEQQRAALARALAAKPSLLLLDEPFSALDENLREEMRALVLTLHREFHMTTVLVTHDRAEALSMSDHIALMFHGELGQCGTPREVYRHPASRRIAEYFGSAAFFEGTATDGIFRCGSLQLPTPCPEGPCALCLRPSAWQLGESGLPCTVQALRFAGEEILLTLRAENGALLQKRLSTPPAVTIGDTVFVTADPAEALFFPPEVTP